MTPERFRRLTEAYGASPERWPDAERDAARALLASGDPGVLAAFADAQALDSLLDGQTVAAPGDALVRRIIASAPVRSLPFWRRPRVWFSGVGFVGAGVAGVAAGALIVSLLTPAQITHGNGWFEQSYSGSAFSAAPDDWSDQ
jgi:hypothetical protein